MKRFIASCIVLVALFTSMFSVSLGAREAYTVENLDITIHVQEDGRLLVREDYDLNFNYYRKQLRTDDHADLSCANPDGGGRRISGLLFSDHGYPV